MVVLDGDPTYTTGHSGTMALTALYKIVSHQTMAMFCKPVNPAEGEKHAWVWCTVRSCDALIDHNRVFTPAALCLLHPFCPTRSAGESVHASNFSLGLFHNPAPLSTWRMVPAPTTTPWSRAGNPAPGPRSYPMALSSREPFAPALGRIGTRCGQAEASCEGAWGKRGGTGGPTV